MKQQLLALGLAALSCAPLSAAPNKATYKRDKAIHMSSSHCNPCHNVVISHASATDMTPFSLGAEFAAVTFTENVDAVGTGIRPFPGGTDFVLGPGHYMVTFSGSFLLTYENPTGSSDFDLMLFLDDIPYFGYQTSAELSYDKWRLASFTTEVITDKNAILRLGSAVSASTPASLIDIYDRAITIVKLSD